MRRVVVKQRRVRFLLEPATAAEDMDAGRARPPESPVWLCSNGWPSTALPTGAPHPGELEELERHIAGAQTRLRQALLRRRELLGQLCGGACDRPLRLLQAYAEAPGTAL